MRLIDKDKLIKAIEKYEQECEDILIEPSFYGVENIINQTPTIDPWHYPSRGELPTESGNYLCAVSYYYETRVETVYYSAEAEQWGSMNRVIAWMPLPEPPKEEA